MEIPTNPQTIVSDYYLGEFLAVDVKPVIASPYALNNPFLAGAVDETGPRSDEALNNPFLAPGCATDALEMNTTADLRAREARSHRHHYRGRLRQVRQRSRRRSTSPTARARTRICSAADLVGKKDAAEAYIAEFNDKVATVKDEIVGIVGDRTVSILEVWPQEIYTMGSHFARGGSILYDMWGLKAPEAVQGPMVEGDEAYKVISVEALPDYAGDFIATACWTAPTRPMWMTRSCGRTCLRCRPDAPCPTSRWPSCTAIPSR